MSRLIQRQRAHLRRRQLDHHQPVPPTAATTWQTPVTARLDTSTQVLNDKESVTGDPLVANNAYAVWDRLVSPNSHANPSAF